jgi:hypothetical protein
VTAAKHDPTRHEPRAVGGILHTEPFAQGGILAPGGPSSGEPDPHPLERKAPKRVRKPAAKRKRKRPASTTPPA